MTRLYLNGKLCNGSGKGSNEYKLSEIKQIAKDNDIFIFSGSTKEEICKEMGIPMFHFYTIEEMIRTIQTFENIKK